MSDQKNSPANQNKPLRAIRTRTSGRGIADRVREIITPTADELGYYLWDVEYVKEGADFILRVTIDVLPTDETDVEAEASVQAETMTEGEDEIATIEGITIDDCEAMSRAIDPILDQYDPIPDAYLLEVSSPGIERELTRDEHFDLCVGEKVEVRLFAPVDGSRVWVGILGERDEKGNVPVETAGTTRAFPRSAISKIRTVFDF
jgi:ribosome maturation factor RimP